MFILFENTDSKAVVLLHKTMSTASTHDRSVASSSYLPYDAVDARVWSPKLPDLGGTLEDTEETALLPGRISSSSARDAIGWVPKRWDCEGIYLLNAI